MKTQQLYYQHYSKQIPISSLHDIPIDGDGYQGPYPQQDFSILDSSPQVFFKNIEEHLINFIQQTRYCVGCIAWLTNFRILEALSSLKGVAFLVQKEDFLRPEYPSAHSTTWKQDLRKAYESLPGTFERYNFIETSQLSVCSDPSLPPVRCVGFAKHNGQISVPRMHHKFLVSGNLETVTETWKDSEGIVRMYEHYHFVPERVWTGSYNFSHNAELSFENCMILDDPKIVQAYMNEWGQLEALSEDLDWSSQWAEPEWRIGT